MHACPAHPPGILSFWRKLIGSSLRRQDTPFYLFSCSPIRAALAELDRHFQGLPVRHWLSCKTQPLRPLLRWWRQQARPIEVVSEFEFLAATAEGFPAEHILVNGPAKHHWLPRHPVPGLRVNFDSVAETLALAPLAARLGWMAGLRVNLAEECDPEAPEYPTQFGMTRDEVTAARKVLCRRGVTPEILHFHLRTNIASAGSYARALRQAAVLCRETGLEPKFVDCGGGIPPPYVLNRAGRRLDLRFDFRAMRKACEEALRLFPSARELWLENGRWLTARSGVLVISVLDAKQRRGMRHLICDGGRTLSALVASWETHGILLASPRRGPRVLTTVAGPTCMAFDQLVRQSLPRSLRPGDSLAWLDAGAYHLPWETRFSHGLAAVLWHDGRHVRTVRKREQFDEWWGQWR